MCLRLMEGREEGGITAELSEVTRTVMAIVMCAFKDSPYVISPPHAGCVPNTKGVHGLKSTGVHRGTKLGGGQLVEPPMALSVRHPIF